MTDCAHRVAASRSIRKHLDESHRAWLAKRVQEDGTRSSLLKLALTSVRLHEKALAKGVVPRTDDDRSQPLLLALTALRTILRNQKENSS